MKAKANYFYKHDLIYPHVDQLGYGFALVSEADKDAVAKNQLEVDYTVICDRDLLYSLHRLLTHAMIDMDKRDTATKRQWLWAVSVNGKFELTKERYSNPDDVAYFYKQIDSEAKIIVSARIEGSEQHWCKETLKWVDLP